MLVVCRTGIARVQNTCVAICVLSVVCVRGVIFRKIFPEGGLAALVTEPCFL